jgi:ABC-type glycerol-3-phosphate transport system substrate-binding protein
MFQGAWFQRAWRLFSLLLVVGILVACAPAAAPAEPAAEATAPAEGTPAEGVTTEEASAAEGEPVQMSFWMNYNFSEAVNELIRTQVQEWADANNVEIDILIAPDADLDTRWSAGLEAPETLPDVSVVFAQWLPRFYDAGLLLDVSDTFAALNELEGGFFPAAGEVVTVQGVQYGVPYIGSVTPAYWRTDALETAGLSAPPATYDEMKDFCSQVNEPGVFWCYGLGFGGFSDPEVQMRNLLWSFGGMVTEEDGVTIALDSPETLAVLNWLVEMNEMGSFPPDFLVGDDSTNNNWYQTRSVAAIVNTGSVLSWMGENDPELKELTVLTPSPAGPAGTHAAGGFGAVLGVFNTTEHPELAKSLLESFASPEQVWARSEAVNFGNLPVHVNAASDPVWEDPYLKPFIDQLQFVHPTGWPGPGTTAAYEVQNQQVLTRMAVRVLSGEQTPEESLAQAVEEVEKIYTEFPPTVQ